MSTDDFERVDVCNSTISSVEELEEILTSLQVTVEYVFMNEFAKLKALFKSRNDSYYHTFGLTLLRAGIGLMTLDKSKFKIALDTAWKGYEESSRRRKKNSGYLFKCDPNEYTDEECHAELVSSEFQAIYGALCVVDDQSLMGFVRGALRVRACFSGLKECERIMKGKTNWKSQLLKDEFCSGVLLDLGLFEMGVSFMPRKFMILLELAGFSSNRSFGLEQLELAATYTTTHRKHPAMIAVVSYYGFIEYFYGLGEVKVNLMKEFLTYAFNLHPTSSYAIGIQGFIHFITGEFFEAEALFVRFLNEPTTPRGLKYILYFYCCWLYMLLGRWRDAMSFSKVLKEECKWSRSLFAYMYAIFTSMVIREERTSESNESLQQSMMEALVSVPRLKRHFGGKKAFHEKIVIEMSQRFVQDATQMVMPHLDLMYLWNMFTLASQSSETLDSIIRNIDHELDKFHQCSEKVRIHSYLSFMRGVAYSAAGRTQEARDTFLSIISMEDKGYDIDKHLIPQSYYELGLIYRRSGDISQARTWLKRGRKYSGYLTETMIQFRIDCVLKSISDGEMMVKSSMEDVNNN